MSPHKIEKPEMFNGQPNTGQVTDQIYAPNGQSENLAHMDSGAGKKVKLVSITDIFPDPLQPRRVIPADIRRQYGYAYDEALYAWVKAACGSEDNDDCWHKIDAVLNVSEAGDDEISIIDDPGLMEIANLAASIRLDGLVNPISIYSLDDGKYMIETGERRWFAHLLLSLRGHGKFAKIPAYIVDRPDVWRQAAENAQRQNLNLVGRARQFAILLMNLYPDAGFAGYDQCPSDRAYYAQVADFRVPDGMSQQLLTGLGITSRSPLVTYRRVLDVSDELWAKADDKNWSESQLFSNLTAGENKPTTLPSVSEAFSKVSAETRQKYRKLSKKAERAGDGQKAVISQILKDDIAVLKDILNKLEGK